MNRSSNSDTKLDLKFNGRLPADISVIFNQLCYNLRGPFNDFVAAVSEHHKTNIDWWVEGPSSRNTLASPLFHYYCCFHLVWKLIEMGKFNFDEIQVDSQALRTILADFIDKQDVATCSVVYSISISVAVKRTMKGVLGDIPLFGDVLQLVSKTRQWIAARRTRRYNSTKIPSQPIVIVDTFMMSGYAASDRWYGSFWDNLPETIKRETFFVPTPVLTSLRSMYSLYMELRSSRRQFLIREDYLTWKDIVYACKHKKRLKSVSIMPVMVSGYDLSSLVAEVMNNAHDTLAPIESLLTYRFIERLSKSGVNVRLSIDWFEGHGIDKAWNLAMREYYPGVLRVGYRAFESFPFYLCSYPIEIEKESGVIPDVMAVQGRGTIPTVREFLPDLDVIVIPAFKAQYVYGFESNRSKSAGFTILVALPISIYSSVRIVDRLIEVCSLTDSNASVNYIIKPHPTVSEDKIKSRIQASLPEAISFTDEKSFPKLLGKANLLITEASSSCLEALACGVPVIIIENEQGLTYDPVPNAVPIELYRKVRTPAQIAEAVAYYIGLKEEDLLRQGAQGLKVRHDYFEPITQEGINRFMNVNLTNETMVNE